MNQSMKILDMHCDTLLECWRHKDHSLRDGRRHLNLKMMKEHGGMGQFFAIYLSRREMQTMDPYDLFQSIYQNYISELQENQDILRPAYCAADILKNAEDGYLSSFLTIEDGVFVDGKIERIQEVYDKGVRLLTLLWGFPNSMGYPCYDDPQQNAQGLTPFGLEVVDKMNELGMIIDVSHLSEGGFYDVARHSKKPFLATHSCAKALCPHKRNLTDDQLKTLGEAGGVVGINFESSFLKKDSDYATVDQIITHIRYMVDKAGIEHVGFGSDFDGIESAGELVDYTGFDKVIDAMRKHYSEDQLDMLLHGNVLRAMEDIIGK